MSTAHDQHHQEQQRRQAASAESTRPAAESVEASGTHDAVREAEIARKRGQGGKDAADQKKGVEWVRVSDLIARRVRWPVAASASKPSCPAGRPPIATTRRVADRTRRLPPVSAFGRRGAIQSGPTRSGVGMS